MENGAAMNEETEKKRKWIDVVAMGELLIDFMRNGKSGQGNLLYEANPGGAPCNVLSMLANLGKKTAFIGKVGNDAFGRLLSDAVEEQGILREGLCYDPEVHTTLAFVTKLPDGDRDFSFYRNPGADMRLSKEDVNISLIKDASIFHFGSLSLTDDPAKTATEYAVQVAKTAGLIISFDPNLRESLWKSLDDAREEIDWGLRQAHVLKISDNEITWFTGKSDYDEGVYYLLARYPNLKLICLSMGQDGSRAYCGSYRVEANSFLQNESIDTTGAGDTFCACVLNTVLEHGIDGLDEKVLYRMLVVANAAASIIITRKGALRVMPSYNEIMTFISERT